MKTTVIYHSADYDGIFCREIAKKFLPDAELIGWNFGDPLIPFPKEGTVYILDLSPDCLLAQVPNHPNTDNKSRMIWIDHHKTSIEKYASDIPGYRVDGVAACRLAWQWFNEQRIANTTGEAPRLPEKRQYVERLVTEPLAVRLAGEYDIWDKRDPDAETFQYGLRLATLADSQWSDLLDENGGYLLSLLLEEAAVAQRYAQHVDASICKNKTFRLIWHGLDFLCLNSARFNSLSFAALDTIENGHDALMGFCWTGKYWTVSLYHAKDRIQIDLSAIAKIHGGGGHKGACGFICKELPFELIGD